MVGGAALFGDGHRAFILKGTTLMKLEDFAGSDWGSALAVNNHGVVVGASNQATALRAFIWTSGGGIRDLGTLLGDSGSQAFGINNLGQAVGYSAGPNGIQAVRWTSDGSIRCSRAGIRGGDSRPERCVGLARFALRESTTMNRIWRYVLAHDSGRAPCVDDGVLTLCTCKPKILPTPRGPRRTAWA